ncbi:MAG: NAD(P)-dependent oxidoreductase [Magnetococcales bacterium]|nr:NAD(P)-dependent oxidoreductase [Magnetococcales bacterium]
MRMLITGSNGFVGRNLQAWFAARGYDPQCPKRQELDLLDSAAVETYLKAQRFDVVIHCGVTLRSVEENLKMYFNLERCHRQFGRMVCVGSGAEYDLRHYLPNMRESYFGEQIPADIYGFSKYVIARDIESNPANIHNLRVFGIYGRHEDFSRRFISNNICRVLSGLDISLNQNMLFDYLYVDDFAAMLAKFITVTPRFKSYNACRGEPVEFLTLARIVRDVHGQEVEIRIKESGMRPEYTGDNRRFIDEFGPVSFTPESEAIEKLYAWYQEGGNPQFDPESFRRQQTG